MEPTRFAKQMIDFQKSTFDNSFNAMVMLQEQAERVGKLMLDQATWLPDEGRKAIEEWMKSFQKGREEFKKTVDHSFNRATEFFETPESDRPEEPKEGV